MRFTEEQLAQARLDDNTVICCTCGELIGAESGCEECAEWVQEMIHYGVLPGPDDQEETEA